MAGSIDNEVRSRTPRQGLILPYGHANAYQKLKNTELIAACDSNIDNLNKFCNEYKINAKYSDYKEMIKNEELDIVSIVTPPDNRCEMILHIVENNLCGIFTEKPLCLSLSESDKIIKILLENKTSIVFGGVRRNWSIFKYVRELYDNKKFGKLKTVLAFSGFSERANHLNPIGGHFIDTIQFLSGDSVPLRIKGKINFKINKNNLYKLIKQDKAITNAQIDLANGVTIYIIPSEVLYEYELIYEYAIIRIQNDGESILIRKRDHNNLAWDKINHDDIAHKSGTIDKIQNLIIDIESNKGSIVNINSVKNSQEIGFGLYESYLSGEISVCPPIKNRSRIIYSR